MHKAALAKFVEIAESDIYICTIPGDQGWRAAWSGANPDPNLISQTQKRHRKASCQDLMIATSGVTDKGRSGIAFCARLGFDARKSALLQPWWYPGGRKQGNSSKTQEYVRVGSDTRAWHGVQRVSFVARVAVKSTAITLGKPFVATRVWVRDTTCVVG